MDKRIGAQYYTIRDFIKTIEDFDAACKKISDIGYKVVQISGTPLGAKQMRSVLDKYNLTCCCTHRAFEDFERNIDEIIDYNKTLGSELCGVGCMPEKYRACGSSELGEFISLAGKAAEELRRENLFFGYHNHQIEFRKVGGKPVIDRLIDETDPESFMFIADTYWLQYGGADICRTLEKMGSRAMMVHLKDFGINDKMQIEMREIGSGNLSWDSIIKTLANIGTRFAIVEQDTNWADGDPFHSLKTSYDFLKSKGFC